ncbi:MAG: ATP-dependent DNA helicase RecG [Lachnospiraceae bacterium]|nr:ATP-dependent DNA helicase RecG [Lachnospiraceae bacterium]
MTSLTAIKGIGEKNAVLYSKIGIDTVEDCVFYFPRDYVKYERLCGPDELTTDRLLAFEAVVVKRPLVRRVKRLSITTVMLSASSTAVSATWFNMPYLSKSLKSGSSYVFYGRLETEGDHFHIRQPRIFTKEQYEQACARINPVYHLTKGLTNNAVSKTVKRSFEYLGDSVRHELYDMHFPKDEETLLHARNSLVYEEFLHFILRLRLLRSEGEVALNDFNIIEVAQCNRIIEKLPFRLTGAQLRVWDEVKEDLCSDRSMRRLIQGDVGSGKTIIATLAAVMCAMNSYQCAIMAPTEILADQHYQSVTNILKESGIDLKVALLTGSMSETSKKNVREMARSGEVSILIGTHALFQEKVIYKNLALVITDEQHRFGVGQRSALTSKNASDNCHVLVMSATPIPRSLALILYGDLDISVIDELPAHKKPIKNAVVNESYRATAYRFIEKEVKAGHQVYVICPLIEESAGMDARNVTDMYSELRSVFEDSVKIGMLHGRMKAADKQKVMDDFSNNYINILISTTVVEVGVNVPNATVMMIENADRFGLAALHQLRGRIGRGQNQSYCIFMSASDNEKTMKRLEILKENNDGFKIADEDLKLRGPGDVFGFAQSGEMDFLLADIYSDAELLKKAAADADRILRDDPSLSKSSNSELKRAVNNYGRIHRVDETL